ncbi:hypothetical protein Taro_048120 [Colocasia esculenta]|uniref:Uncharacterized protein n=1 Tax=Colocasia esculenta TaxID=4460 RepID=A0A843WUX1_COLES|nr:hypothetical protein [Colocasia esculenta]
MDVLDTGMHGILDMVGAEGEIVVAQAEAAETELRRGPWTAEEDHVLVNYISLHGEGRWNSLARSAGLKRSGKSCRLRWLNYLRPDVRRGNFTAEEQLVILDLHSRWGNRWSKIAQHLPGRTDNEIKNYWRTRVQKHAKQLKCDVNSQQFKDAMRYLWMPRLMEKIQAASESSAAPSAAPYATTATALPVTVATTYLVPAATVEAVQMTAAGVRAQVSLLQDHSGVAGLSPDSSGGTWLSSPSVSNLTYCHVDVQGGEDFTTGHMVSSTCGYLESLLQNTCGYLEEGFPHMEQTGWEAAGILSSEGFWDADDTWFLEHEL